MSSHELFTQAKQHIPGGVNSPVRAFNGVGGEPVFFERGEGAYLIDTDGKSYIDFVGSWGPLILGHNNPQVIEAITQQLTKGASFGAPTQIETQMAEKICQLVPSIEMVRMVSSGTEATMSAIRLARGYTGRDRIVKFEGCYHGHADSLLVKAGSGALTLGEPSSLGVPAALANLTTTLTYNNIEEAKTFFAESGSSVACVIVEPVAGNMNCIPASNEFLQTLRQLCDEYNCVLIFDEVMSGFRVSLGGAQEIYGITPDLTTLGKVIGGGLPVGAFGGKKAIMEYLAPLGAVYQAGTLSGNPLAMAAGLTTLNIISQPNFFNTISASTNKWIDGLNTIAQQQGIAFSTNHVGGMFGLFFSDEKNVSSFAQVSQCNLNRFKEFYHLMLDEGVYLAPSAFEAGFISSQHSDQIINKALAAAEIAFTKLKRD